MACDMRDCPILILPHFIFACGGASLFSLFFSKFLICSSRAGKPVKPIKPVISRYTNIPPQVHYVVLPPCLCSLHFFPKQMISFRALLKFIGCVVASHSLQLRDIVVSRFRKCIDQNCVTQMLSGTTKTKYMGHFRCQHHLGR